jgi:glycosyltransferase involved in cell wall biosynthesis
MHVVFASQHFHKNPGGPRKAALAMAAALDRLGHTSSVLGLSPRSGTEPLPGGGTAHHRRYWWKLIPVRYGRSRFYARELERLHKQQPIDVVVAMGLTPAAAALRFREKTGVPFILNPRSFLKTGRADWKNEIARNLMQECDAFVAQSDNAADAWCEALDYPRDDKVVGVPNGIDVEQLNGDAEPPPGLTGAPIVLCTAMLRKVKGQHLLLKALARMTDVEWQLVLAGESPAREAGTLGDLEKLTAELGLTDRVLFTGMVVGAPWRWLYRNAQVFALMPVYMEACPNSLLEALAAGLPIIVSDAGSMPEIVGDAAQVVPVGPPPWKDETIILPALEAALRKLLGDADLRERLGKAAKERAAGMSWEHCVQSYLDALASRRAAGVGGRGFGAGEESCGR